MKSINKVAVLGPEGTFTEAAARKMYPGSELEYCESVSRVFERVGKDADYGVVAIENSIEGSVNTTVDNLLEHDLNIVKEEVIDVNLCLVALPKTSKSDIKCVISHPHALAQCEKYLRKKFMGVRTVSYESTAAAIKEIRDMELRDTAAIGSKDTAAKYGLEIMDEGIQDTDSQTRFVAIAKTANAAGKKTSVILSLKDTPGSLYDVLSVFARERINLTKIESRPSKKRLGEYLFYIDFEGSVSDRRIAKIMDEVKERTTYMKLLGSY